MLGLPPVRLPRHTPWLLNCCVAPPQSEIGRLRVDRSLIGSPSNFRHIGHVGAGDKIASSDDDDGTALGALLRSKGGMEHAMKVSTELRATDQPIGKEQGLRKDA